jgi:hypothetical protein
MTVTTRFEIGEKVWIIDHRGEGSPVALQVTIRTIEINLFPDQELQIRYEIEAERARANFLESQCFSTREELIESL